MKETGKERFILTKAYEVAYALRSVPIGGTDAGKEFCRTAPGIRHCHAPHTAAAAGKIIRPPAGPLRVMECLVKFGGDVGVIGTPNVDVMTREIFALDAAIAGTAEPR